MHCAMWLAGGNVTGQRILAVQDLTVHYPSTDHKILMGCSLSIGQGERVALFGLNGSGKTSLLLAIAGILPFEGSIVVDGICLASTTTAKVRSKIGFLFATPDDQLLFPRVLDDVEFSLASLGLDQETIRGRATTMLHRMGVGDLHDHTPHTLSHGQKVRVALAGALVHHPPLLLLDEPSNALDPPARRGLAATLTGHPGAMLMATHDQEFTRKCCTRFVLLEGGKIVKDTLDPEEIRL